MNQRTRIKTCGVRDVPTALACVAAGADAVGLVFVPGSPRCVTEVEAREIVRALPAYVGVVGLFVGRPTAEVLGVAQGVGLHAVQLHGGESPEDVARLHDAGLSVTRALGVGASGIDALLAPWRGARGLAGLVLDAPASGDKPGQAGGTGLRFDWAGLRAYRESHGWEGLAPLILAGGLTPENVGRAIGVLSPYAVDVSSGIESSRGVKDVAKVRAFCDAVRAADAGPGVAAG